MSDPAADLQRALYALLIADAGVAASGKPPIGNRIYDAVPSKPVFPYIVIGDDQVLGDDDSCGEGSEVFAQIHSWSRAAGFLEVKTIAGAIRHAVISTQLTITGFDVVVTQFLRTLYLPDPDPLTRHAVTEFRFLISHN